MAWLTVFLTVAAYMWGLGKGGNSHRLPGQQNESNRKGGFFMDRAIKVNFLIGQGTDWLKINLEDFVLSLTPIFAEL